MGFLPRRYASEYPIPTDEPHVLRNDHSLQALDDLINGEFLPPYWYDKVYEKIDEFQFRAFEGAAFTGTKENVGQMKASLAWYRP